MRLTKQVNPGDDQEHSDHDRDGLLNSAAKAADLQEVAVIGIRRRHTPNVPRARNYLR